MRALRLIAIVVAIGAATTYGISIYRSSSFQASLPEAAPSPPLSEASVKYSTILLPIKVKIEALKKTLDAKVDRIGEDKEDDFAGGLLRKDYLQYQWQRGDFSLASDGGGLRLSVPLSGNAYAEGILIVATLSGSAVASGSAAVTVRPELRENWRLAANLSDVNVNLSLAELDLGPKISVRTALSKIIRKAADKQLGKLNERIASDPFLENALRRAWTDVCRNLPIDGGTPGQEAPFFVMVEPVEVMAAQPVIAGEDVDLLVGVQARIAATSAQRDPVCPFPKVLKLVPPAKDGRFSVTVPVETTFDHLNGILARRVAGRTFADEDRGLDVVVRSLTLRPFGSRLLLTAEVTVRSSGVVGYVSGQASGTVYAVAEPVLDAQKRELAFKNVRLDVASQRPLTAIVGDTAASVVERILTDRARIDLGKELDKLRARSEAAVEALNRKTGEIKTGVKFNIKGLAAGEASTSKTGGIRTQAKLDKLDIENLAFDNKRLRILATAEGAVRTEVLDIPFGK